ncbi:hypothetical protein POM88_014938 [Heracleum sosnowskyi]|uniref:RNA polymerase Rpb5 N-terminal domain-containing protein n=1 Tax=Heracleum sosnowskyi TaxID=360622 RepID=A0AAD8MRF7_9APIA|nr:hypothetical protein POM88_014938 [Heracleum sosnowskyi]
MARAGLGYNAEVSESSKHCVAKFIDTGSAETHRLYLARRTVLEMLKDRGYSVEQSEIDMSLAEFRTRFGEVASQDLLHRLRFSVPCISCPSEKNLGHFKGVVASDKSVFSPRFRNATGRPPPLDLNLVPELASRIKEVPVDPCFALMLAFEQPLSSIPLKGFSFLNSKVLSRAYYESSKPGRSTQSENWVLHSTAEYAENVIAQKGLQKLPAATLDKIAEELFQEFQNTGFSIPRPFFKRAHRWYWDVVWSKPEHPGDITDRFEGIHFSVVLEDEDQVELSFKKTYNPSLNKNGLRLNVDKRYIYSLRGISGFYSYSIFEHLEEHPAIVLYQGRIVFRLQDELFRYMAVSDDRQRSMPTAEDRKRGQPLHYPEAVLLTNPSNTFLKEEADDKYQCS